MAMDGRRGAGMAGLRFAALVCCAALAACGKDAPPPAPPLPKAVAGNDMVLIPAGEFIMGSDKTDTAGLQREYGLVDPLYLNEHPPRRVHLDTFLIDKYEVTSAQYKAYLAATGAEPPQNWVRNAYNVADEKLRRFSVENLRWIATEYFRLDADTNAMGKDELLDALLKEQRRRDMLPATGVNWYDAASYCKWAGGRLPAEAEWEKAARGPSGQEYPWGNEWDEGKTNTGADREEDEGIVPVGSMPADKSPYGVYDMAGNVSEWVADWYQPYPGSTYRHEAFGEIHKALRGGGAGLGHYALSAFFRGARRAHADPTTAGTDVGFRCARDVLG